MLRNLTRENPCLYLDRAEWSLRAVPRVYVKLLNDAGATPAQQDEMIARLDATRVVTMNTGHLPMLARPEEMAAVLSAAW